MLTAMSPDEFESVHAAASRLQNRWRACQQKVMLQEYMRAVYSQPDLDKARKHGVGFLPKDRHGNLLPLTAPLKVRARRACAFPLQIGPSVSFLTVGPPCRHCDLLNLFRFAHWDAV
jgi:hypothetical protein